MKNVPRPLRADTAWCVFGWHGWPWTWTVAYRRKDAITAAVNEWPRPRNGPEPSWKTLKAEGCRVSRITIAPQESPHG